MHDHSTYPGKELLLFEKARKWKQYFSSFIKPYIKKKVLEVGAGLGSNTPLLNDGSAEEWILLEPDTSMSVLLQQKVNSHELAANCKVEAGTLSQFEKKEYFDTIIYIDVLEHIYNDKSEVENAFQLLKPDGYLIILSPAFPCLYSRFDKAIGHFRRYNKRRLNKVIPASLAPIRLRYLDTSGFLLSLVNRFLSKQKYPTQKQVDFWDRHMIPVSRIVDRIVIYSYGKTILGIWKKEKP